METLTIQAGRVRPRGHEAREQALVADQRLQPRQAGGEIGAGSGPGVKLSPTAASCFSPSAFEQLLQRQVFAEGHQPVLVVEADLLQPVAVASQGDEAVEVERPSMR